jgi:hypothetical protein
MEPRPAGAWRVLAAFAGLALLAGLVGVFVLVRTGAADPDAVLAEAFDVRALPFELRPVYAAELPLGTRCVRFEPAAQAVAAPAELDGAASTAHAAGSPPPSSPGGADSVKDEIVWKKLPIAPPGAPPLEAYLVLTGSRGRAGVNATLDEASAQSLGDLGEDGGLVAVDSGTFPWDAYEPRYVHARRFERPGIYTDSVRVDVSANGRWCVLVVGWPRGVTGSKEAAFELAHALVPKPKAASAP